MFAWRIHPRYTETGFGLPLFFVVAPAAFLAILHPFVLVTFGVVPDNAAQVALNHVLLGLLGAMYIAWALALSRRWVDEVSGAGFALMGFALAARVYCEFVLVLPGDFVGFEHANLGPQVRAFRAATLFGYAFGLASIVSSVWAARRRRGGP